MSRTKIVATIGPVSATSEAVGALIDAGVDVARLNASHTSGEELEERLGLIRASAAGRDEHVAIMLDLQGPKIRTGSVEDGIVLAGGQPFDLFTGEHPGDGSGVSIGEPALAAAVGPEDVIVIGDGEVELEVLAAEPEAISTRVIHGGPLGARRGVTARGVSLDVPALTTQDETHVRWGIERGVDFFAQSFVRGSEDVETLRALVGDRPVVAKIERHEALDRIEAIVDVADAVMVARGDLGVATSPELVPIAQKRIVRAARAAGKPVIVATQMLESMLDSPEPTRAEASDVANAVFDSVDAIMLSAETAIGRFPTESVAMMSRIARMAEASGFHDMPSAPGTSADVPHAVSAAVCDLAARLKLAAIVTATQTGATARSVAANRPETPIVAVTPDAAVARALALVWGVVPIVGREPSGVDDLIEIAMDAARQAGCGTGDLVAITAGVSVGQAGGTDLIQVHRL